MRPFSSSKSLKCRPLGYNVLTCCQGNHVLDRNLRTDNGPYSTTLRHFDFVFMFWSCMFSFITSISGLILSCNETMIFVCIYLQSSRFMSVNICEICDKILNHVEKQSITKEVVKNTTNPGMRMAVYRKIFKLRGR